MLSSLPRLSDDRSEKVSLSTFPLSQLPLVVHFPVGKQYCENDVML